MGQKVHPGGLRVGVIHDWKSNWMVGKKEFAGALIEDIRIREHILKKLSHAGLSDILIRKDKQRITIDIYTARPGIVIGKSGVEVDALRREIHAMTQKNVHININEIKRPELDAKLVAQSIAEQLQNRVSFRRAMKRSLASAIRSGAAGVKVQCSGRLGGAEMSRSEQYSEGRVPLHTIRADIDYGFVEARTPTGRIGVKVWINKGEIMPEGYGGIPGGGKETRLGDQDAARRRGGVSEGLGASREAGRGRQQDREGLGPVRRGRPGQRRGPGAPRAGGGQGRPGGGPGAPGAGGPRMGGDRPAGGRPEGGGRPSGSGQRPAGGGRARGSQGGRPGFGDRARGQDNVERPRTDEAARSAEGREQPPIEPTVEETPKPVAEAPDTTTPKTMQEDPTKLDSSGSKGEHGGSGAQSEGSSGSKGGDR
jgi:small subunit ribosomal protein S3